jgi:FtsP/CotA-like multicopper oxidase with cupredoxin domain
MRALSRRPSQLTATSRFLTAALATVGLLSLTLGSTAPRAPTAPARVLPNDNRISAGSLRGGVLTLRLEARVAEWHPDGEQAPGAPMFAFAERGGPARIPGPLVRVPAGTKAEVSVHNTLGDTLRVYGLHARPRSGEPQTTPLVLAPGETRAVRFALDAPGTYLYWGTTMGRPIAFRTRDDSQLSGAIVVDSAGAPSRDRVLVIGEWADTVDRVGIHRQRVLAVINGRSWPNTERLIYTVGDTVRWRVINASADLHPMHLHGFYFRVTSRGDGVRDTIYAPREDGSTGDLAVTEGVISGGTISLDWVPERAGNWLFHCHVPEHIAARGPLGTAPSVVSHSSPHSGEANHARGGMNGLALGVTVRPATRAVAARVPSARERHLRLLVRANVGSTDNTPFFSYALHEGGAEPAVDTGLVAAPTLDLVRDEPVRITIVNRLAEPTAVHWHGIELENYYDGVPGFSGAGRQTPMIAPNDSFEVRFTPPRAGTFIYHTHVDEPRQQHAGLVGALIVREPGSPRDPATDIPLVITSPTAFELNRRQALFNATASPAPLEMKVGSTYRLRLIVMSVNRAAATIDLWRGDTLLTWRPVAKDGAAFPAHARVAQPATTFLSIGETADFEFTPVEPGDMQLQVRYGVPRGAVQSGSVIVAARLPIRVSAATAPANSASVGRKRP